MANFLVTGSNDMTALDLSTLSGGTIVTSTNTQIVITATDGTTYDLTGDFSGGSATTLPTSGAITGWVADKPDASHVVFTNFNLPISDFNAFLHANDGIGLEKEIFAGNDTFNLTNGDGQNNVFGGAGDDTFRMGTTLDANDQINGGAGNNTVQLDGNYSGLTLTDTTLTNIATLQLVGSNAYDITTADGTITGGRTLNVDARQLGPSGALTFDGSAETAGSFHFFLGGTGSLNVTGGAGNDIFQGGGAGATLNGGAGNDQFLFVGQFDGTDNINGGAGFNTLTLNGDYSAGLNFGATSLVNINQVIVGHGNDYDLTLNAANDTVGGSFEINGSGLWGTDALTFDGSLATGHLTLVGGAGNDTMTGGSGSNVFNGGAGSDTMTAGAGSDAFVYTSVTDSGGPHVDNVIGFDTTADSFVVPVAVTAIDAAVTTGALNAAAFDAGLTHDIGAAQLAAHHAVEFTPDSGDEAGNFYLVIDQNGVAGFQANQDLVIQLTGSHNIGLLSTADFVTH